jgi:hypothetical protein
MATNPLDAQFGPEKASTATVTAFPSPTPLPAVTRILGRFTRPQMEGFIAVAIDLLDTLDGEADLEGEPDDASWPERAGAGCRFPLRADLEDCEDDDANEVDDPGGTDLDFGERDDALRMPISEYTTDQRIMITSRERGVGLNIDTLCQVNLERLAKQKD